MKQASARKEKKIVPRASTGENQPVAAAQLNSIEAKAMLDQLCKSYPHPVPSVKEVRAMLDRALGRHTLTEELRKLRQEEPVP